MNKNANFFLYAIILLMGLFIISAIVNPSILSSIKNSFSSSQTTDPMISSCLSAYQECANRVNMKYGWTYSFIKAEKFEDYDSANKFLSTWGEVGQGMSFILYDPKTGIYPDKFPVVLIASTITISGQKNPWVLLCDKNSSLEKNFAPLC